MKKLMIVVLLLIVSLISYGQDNQPNLMEEFLIVKSGRTLEMTQKFHGRIVVSDSTISFEQSDKTDVYLIRKKQFVNGNVFYIVSNEKTPEIKEEFILNTKYNYFEHSVIVERISGSKFVSQMYIFKKDTKKSEPTRSLGGVIGLSTFIGTSNQSSASYGGYVDFGNFGLEYHSSASVNTDFTDMNRYINGQTNEYVAGGGSMNFGAFQKFTSEKNDSFYLGLGIQSYTEISAKNVSQTTSVTVYNPVTRRNETRTQTTMVPQVTEDKKILPYFTIGYLVKLNEIFTFKGGLIVSKTSMINVGIGYNF
jgi:hypothetical protein